MAPMPWRVVVVDHLSLVLLVVALVLSTRRIRSMALRFAVVVSHAPGLRGHAVGRPPLDGGRERLGRRLLGNVEVTETPGQGGDHPRPLLVVGPGDRLPDVDLAHSLRNGRTSTFRLQCFDPSAASLSATSRSAASMIQKPTMYSSDSTKGPSVNNTVSRTPVVDDGGRAGRPEAAGEDPVALGLEPLVELVDRGHLGWGGHAVRVVDHGNQVLHLGSSPVVPAPPPGGRSHLLRTPPPRSDTASRMSFKDLLLLRL